jgi:hypothetical protein
MKNQSASTPSNVISIRKWKPAAIFQHLTEIAGPAAAADPYRLATLVLKLFSHQITAILFVGIVYNEIDLLFLA